MRWLLRLLGWSRPSFCSHELNYSSRRWLATDGTPMVRFHCIDCGYTDQGHVHADAEGWTDLTVVVRNGEEVSQCGS